MKSEKPNCDSCGVAFFRGETYVIDRNKILHSICYFKTLKEMKK